MSTPDGPLARFFEQFNFQRYTYDPDTPAREEFDRLCEARQWGPSRVEEHETDFFLALERENMPPLARFFEQFNFQKYTYDPDIPAFEEFDRLCEARRWGLSKIQRHKTAFLLALEQERDLSPLAIFFEQFNFQRYTYDPDVPALEEFDRLCEARQWGPSRVEENETDFYLALEKDLRRRGSSTGIEVVKFFRGYEYRLFTYNLDAPAQSEFLRLVGLRGWGERRLLKVTKRFNNAVALDEGEQSMYSTSESTGSGGLETPGVELLANWLRKQECHGYWYRGDPPELEFKRLADVKRGEWLRGRGLELGRELTREERREWKESAEFEELRNGFYTVVEDVFNALLNDFCQATGLAPWQVLVGLYGEGQVAVGKEDAKTILQDVFINIFDFLDAFNEILKKPTINGPNLLHQLQPLARELEFPNNLMLGVYSSLTHRVFPGQLVNKEGTLVLLLHHIKSFLRRFEDVMNEFEEEAGYELAEAEEEGPAGIRRLLLSREWDCLYSLRSGLHAVPF